MRRVSDFKFRISNVFRISGFLFLISGTVLAVPSTVSAQACTPTQSILGIPTWYKYIPGETVEGKCTPRLRGANPEESVNNVLPIGIAVLEAGITVGALVAFIMVLWGAFNYLLSLGEPDKTASAQKTVINAMIGLVILLISTRVVAFIGSAVTSTA